MTSKTWSYYVNQGDTVNWVGSSKNIADWLGKRANDPRLAEVMMRCGLRSAFDAVRREQDRHWRRRL